MVHKASLTTPQLPAVRTTAAPAEPSAPAASTSGPPAALDAEGLARTGSAWSHSVAADGSSTGAAALAAHLPKARSTPGFPGMAEVASTKPASLSPSELQGAVATKMRCPFIGSAALGGELPVRNDAERPLGSTNDVKALGNTGGGDLGKVLEFFAKGNHQKMPGESGKLDQQVPNGTFSLDLAGSQGAHPGHSGIMMGDPSKPNTGRLSTEDFDRLAKLATPDGYLTEAAVGKFIAENLVRDPNSKVAGKDVAHLLAKDFGQVLATSGGALAEKLKNWVHGSNETEAHNKLLQKLTKLAGEDNLVGSSGEFGLLFALLANSPGTKKVDGQPAISLAEARGMFVDNKLPEGWKEWPKTSTDWAKASTLISISAAKEYAHLKHSS